MRSLFHLMVGKPDSTQQSFKRPVCISPEAIINLNELIKDKLKNHKIEGMVISVDVTNTINQTIQFGTWIEFLEHKWTSPEETTEVSAKWDFVVYIPGFDFPQRHSINLKITNELKPIHLLRQVFSEEREHGDDIEISFNPVVCRVDFINHILSKELLNIVSDWNRSLPQPKTKTSWIDKFKDKSGKLNTLIAYSGPLLILIAAFVSLNYLASPQDPKSIITVGFLSKLMYWLLGSLSALYGSLVFSKWLGRKAESLIDKYGVFSVFEMTSGDKNKIELYQKRNKSIISNFLITTGAALLLNISAGMIVWWLTK